MSAVSVAQIASLQATGVVLSPKQYSQLGQFLHSHDRLTSSCLVAVPAFNFCSLAKRYSRSLTLQGVCYSTYCIQNYLRHWLSYFEQFSIYFSRWSLCCELFCHSTAIQRYFCCWSPRSDLLFGYFLGCMADNFIHHGPSARAHVPYSVLEFKRRSNYQQRNKCNFVLPWFICSSQVTSIKDLQRPQILT